MEIVIGSKSVYSSFHDKLPKGKALERIYSKITKILDKDSKAVAVIRGCEIDQEQADIIKGIDESSINSLHIEFVDCTFVGYIAHKNFSEDKFVDCDFIRVMMYGCSFNSCHINANFVNCAFIACNLQNANIEGRYRCDNTVFTDCNLSGTTLNHFVRVITTSTFNDAKFELEDAQLERAREFLSGLERDQHGWLAYKCMDVTLKDRSNPDSWKIEPGEFIDAYVNRDYNEECSAGVNFGNAAYCSEHYSDGVWRVRIPFEEAASVVIPTKSLGKARCARLQLLEQIDIRDWNEIRKKNGIKFVW